jgi:hypothetical protein
VKSIATHPTPVTEDFYRYEFKYFLSLQHREEVESEVANFMNFDGHVHEDLDQAYYVRSLYFENEASTHFYEKTDGIRVRRKYRLRTYGTSFDPELPIYLEEKNRNLDRVQKHRVRIDPKHLEIFYNPLQCDELLELYSGVELIERFLFDALRRSIQPKLLVDYIRRPYVSAYDMNFRVTFDSTLLTTATNQLFPSSSSNWLESLAGYTILEVKFNRRIPVWFHRILQSHNMRRLSFSKFVQGMEATGLAIDLS